MIIWGQSNLFAEAGYLQTYVVFTDDAVNYVRVWFVLVEEIIRQSIYVIFETWINNEKLNSAFQAELLIQFHLEIMLDC